MTGPEDLRPGTDWDAFRSARDRFLARVRPDAMDDPPPSICPAVVPEGWLSAAGGEELGPDMAGG